MAASANSHTPASHTGCGVTEQEYGHPRGVVELAVQAKSDLTSAAMRAVRISKQGVAKPAEAQPNQSITAPQRSTKRALQLTVGRSGDEKSRTRTDLCSADKTFPLQIEVKRHLIAVENDTDITTPNRTAQKFLSMYAATKTALTHLLFGRRLWSADVWHAR